VLLDLIINVKMKIAQSPGAEQSAAAYVLKQRFLALIKKLCWRFLDSPNGQFGLPF
tara:strand:- start:401 stop:568 length:168 start_codon:yes stop_codon:yes gene_type:complete